jgi:hypothetical protein
MFACGKVISIGIAGARGAESHEKELFQIVFFFKNRVVDAIPPFYDTCSFLVHVLWVKKTEN